MVISMTRRLTVRATVATAAALGAALVPVFLFGALSEQIRRDIAFDKAAIGIAVSVFFVVAAVGAPVGGWVTQRIGSRRSMLLGVALASTASFGIGLMATSWWSIVMLLALAGATVGLIDTGAAQTFTELVPTRRQGLAFGIKEGSIPAASMLAGSAVPLLALTAGWRSAFVATALLAPLISAVLLPRESTPRRGQHRASEHRARPCLLLRLLLAVGAGAGAGAGTATATYLVPAVTNAGLSPGAGGTLLAIGSASGIATRLLVGWRADQQHPTPQLPTVAILQAIGALGPILLALTHPATAVAGSLLALGIGWGWPGLIYLVAVRADPTAPAAAAGTVLAGLSIGAATGPVLFGLAAATTDYSWAWVATTAALTLGATACTAAHRTTMQHRQ